MIKYYKVTYREVVVIEKIQSVGRNQNECENRLFQYMDEIYFDKKLSEQEKEHIGLIDLGE